MWRDAILAVGGVGAVLGLWLAVSRWAAAMRQDAAPPGQSPECKTCSSVGDCPLHQPVQPQAFTKVESWNGAPHKTP